MPSDSVSADTTTFLGRVMSREPARVVDALDVETQLVFSPPETGGAVHAGDLVLARKVNGGARILERLAQAGTPRAELYEILLRYRLSPAFPDDVVQEVEAWRLAPGIDDASLVDLTPLPFVTIDGATAKDLDQAVYVAQEPRGYRVYYALADASHFVRPGSALWREAVRRAASYYLPGVMVPMLPPELSEGLISLNPNVDRRCLVLETQLHPDGRLRGGQHGGSTRAYRARIRSREKLSFGAVQAFYEAGAADLWGDASVAECLRQLRNVGIARQQQEQERNVVRYRRVELDVSIQGQGVRRFVAAEAIRHPVEAYNEQLSLLCNSEGARLLREAAVDPLIEPIYRVHPPPEQQRLEELRRLTRAITAAHDLDERWTWQAGQSLADYLEALPEDAPTRNIARAIHRQAVMVNVASTYQALPERHSGVGADVYARFSAPMRELVGIFLHRELLQALEHQALDDRQLREQVIERANYAKQTQKRLTNESNLLVLDQIFGEQLQLAPERRGLAASIVGMSRSKVYVLFDDYPIDAKVNLRDLRNALQMDVQVSGDGSCVTGDGRVLFRIGDGVVVVVAGHERARGHWQLALRCLGPGLPLDV